MKKYPFIFLKHGKISYELIGDYEEIFIWFKRKITKYEQNTIIKNCPRPINYVFYRGKEFLYYGNKGDNYGFDIVTAYSKEDSKKLKKYFDTDNPEFDNFFTQCLKKTLPIFINDFNLWINKVNEIVPIAFTVGLNATDKFDDWGNWSKKIVYDTAMPYLRNYINKYQNAIKKNKIESEIFGNIYDFLMYYAIFSQSKKIDLLLNDIELAFELDRISSYFERLSPEDDRLQDNAKKLYSLLDKLTQEKRIKKISKLKPYTQFAYYSSYASKNDLLINKDPVKLIKSLILKLPVNRKKIILPFLQLIAENLAIKNLKHSDIAAEILEISLNYGAKENLYIKCAELYSKKNNFKEVLRVSLKGIKKFPDNQSLIANILFASEKTKKPELAKNYINLKSNDPYVIANQSHLLISAGKIKEAYELLLDSFNKNIEFNFYAFFNFLSACLKYQLPDKKTVDKLITKAIKNLNEKSEFIHHDFAVNLTMLLLNLKRYNDIIEIVKLYKSKGGEFINTGLYCNYSCAAYYTYDNNIINKALDEIISEYNKSPEFFTEDKYYSHIALSNIASLYALLKDKNNMMKFLKIIKKVHYDFNVVKSNEDFKDYWDDPDFKKL